MLVLTRRVGQRIAIATPAGEVVWVTLMAIQSARQVRLGVEAAPHIDIRLEEILEGNASCSTRRQKK